MCTLILKLLPSILLSLALKSYYSFAKVSVLDLSGLLPFDASSIKLEKLPSSVLTSDILLVGGKEAMQLEQAFKHIAGETFTKKLKISSITSPDFNLARITTLFSFYKIKPRWVIYLPSENDEKEEIFFPKDSPSLQFNLQRGQTWWWQLLYKIWPGLALATLKKIHVVQLPLEPLYKLTPLNDAQKVQQSLTHAALFKLMLEQWILESPKTKFLFVSTPLNPSIAPQNCKTSLQWPTKNFLRDQAYQLAQENWDKALEANTNLMKVAPYYASTYYTRAKILHQLKDFEKSRRFLNLSWILDCRQPVTALKNAILQSQTMQFPGQVFFYNLSQLVVDECFQQDPTCFEGQELQKPFYQSAAKIMSFIIQEIH